MKKDTLETTGPAATGDWNADDQPAAIANGAVATPSAKPKRKFHVQIGSMEFQKRATVAEMVAETDGTQGVRIELELDGYTFALLGPAS